jgi:molybdopterin converting factor small subunit
MKTAALFVVLGCLATMIFVVGSLSSQKVSAKSTVVTEIFLVNGTNLPAATGTATPLAEGDHVSIFPLLGGG